jgi:hypothetical protein
MASISDHYIFNFAEFWATWNSQSDDLAWRKIVCTLYIFAHIRRPVEKSLGKKFKYVCNSMKKQMQRNLTRKRKLNLKEQYGHIKSV